MYSHSHDEDAALQVLVLEHGNKIKNIAQVFLKVVCQVCVLTSIIQSEEKKNPLSFLTVEIEKIFFPENCGKVANLNADMTKLWKAKSCHFVT